MRKVVNIRRHHKRTLFIFIGIVFALILFFLFIQRPLVFAIIGLDSIAKAGALTKFHIYRTFCGHDPVIASSFMESHYYLPGDESYDPPNYLADTYFCTEEDAKAANYKY